MEQLRPKIESRHEALSSETLQGEANFEIQAMQLLKYRRAELESIKHLVSIKLYDDLERKLAEEQRLLELYTGKVRQIKKVIDKYSLLLDQTYFDQKLLPEL